MGRKVHGVRASQRRHRLDCRLQAETGGAVLDQETGLHQNWLRYYDPDTGRYTTSDPIGLRGGLNEYAYAFGMPLDLSDPWGLAPESCTPSPKDQECGRLRKQIFEKYAKLIDELQKYDPVADGIGGHPHAHGVTRPGGHYDEINDLQRGINNDIKTYNRKCKDRDKDDGSGGAWGAIPRSIDEAANRPVEPPVYPPAATPPTTTPYSPLPEPFGEPSKPKPVPTGPNVWPIIIIPLLILWGLLGG